MGDALSAGGHRAKLKMNVMDTLGTMQLLPATINDERICKVSMGGL